MDVTTIPVTVNGTQNGTPGPHAEEMNNLCEEEQNKKDAEYQLDLLSDFIDNGADGDEEEDETDESDPESPSYDATSSVAGENGVKQNVEKKLENGNTGPKKRRKKNDPTKRKKIRKMLTEDKLNTDTLLAMKEEESRMKRIEEQAQNRVIQQQEAKTHYYPTPVQQRQTNNHSYLATLLEKVPSANKLQRGLNIPSLPQPTKKSEEVICISSDSEDEKTAINISSESDDDVIFTGEVQKEEAEEVDVNNCGMHVEDSMNQPDEQGRVLVNVSRPSGEPEIYLSPQLARAVLPHQIGGIRFMFDNIVESLSHFEKSPGFGCILAHSMGLGKTLQVISFIDVFLRYTHARTVLCVVPVNTLMNWVAEFDMWLPTETKTSQSEEIRFRSFPVHLLCDNHKTIDSRSKVVKEWYSEGGVLLLGYEMYRLLTSRKPRKKKSKKVTKSKISPIIDLEEEDRLSSLSAGMQDSLLQPGPDLIICDEGHRIKNSHASISQMLKNVKTRRRIVLTGYPLQNNLLEYWCMVDFVRPNFLGTRQEFSNMFERPIFNGQCADSTESDVRLMRFRSHVLHSLLKGFVQRRSHSVLQNRLPMKEEHVLMIRLSQWQKKLYNTFIGQRMEGGSGSWCSSANPIKAFSVCCKIWNHPDVLHRTVLRKEEEQSGGNGLLDPDFDLPELSMDSPSRKAKPQPKTSSDSVVPPNMLPQNAVVPFSVDKSSDNTLDWAKELLTGYEPGRVEFSGKMVVLMKIINSSVSHGDKILVFSQSLCTLSLIEEFLTNQFIPTQDPYQPPSKWCKNESYFRLDGNTHSADREKMINHFNNPEKKNMWLFLLSTRAGCLGINLIGANRVVVFDASWNPCHDAQAVCRVYRYGQQKTCHIYRLVCDQSMEKKIYERQISKQGMSDRVVDKLNPSQQFTKQDALKLMEYSDVELPIVDLSNILEETNDPILQETCQQCGQWLTRKPFHHESLLLDCKDQRLTKAEKRAAQKGYERDKLASAAYNYSRPSYANFYSTKSTTTQNSQLPPRSSNFLPRNPSTNFSYTPRSSKPVANVRPMQSTPVPMRLQPNHPNEQTTSRSMRSIFEKSGITVQKVVATESIPLPPNPSSNGGAPTFINSGETICVIQGKKGTYIRTNAGRIFAVRPNDAARFTQLAASGQPDNTNLLQPPVLPPQQPESTTYNDNLNFPTSNQFPTSSDGFMGQLLHNNGPSYTQPPMYMTPQYPNPSESMQLPGYMSHPQTPSTMDPIGAWGQSSYSYDYQHQTPNEPVSPLVSQEVLDDLLSR